MNQSNIVSIAKYQSIAISIAISIEKYQNIATLIAK